MGWLRRWVAHLLTGVRLLAAPLLAAALWRGAAMVALILLALAVVTDLLDGVAARRFGVASDRGRWFDHLADITFLLAGFATLAAIGEVTPLAAAAIAGAFAFYVVDSLRRSATFSLVASRLGHLSGVLNYVVLGIVLLDLASAAAVIPPVLRTVAVASVPVYSAAAVLARVFTSRADPSG